ncbi:MAG TPA: hypothetical protein VEK38_02870 [Candidatus Bathyarchaeia archaeon]|nr:hypothetical protein [Candidatus Bathyarchaeia archaeon]
MIWILAMCIFMCTMQECQASVLGKRKYPEILPKIESLQQEVRDLERLKQYIKSTLLWHIPVDQIGSEGWTRRYIVWTGDVKALEKMMHDPKSPILFQTEKSDLLWLGIMGQQKLSTVQTILKDNAIASQYLPLPSDCITELCKTKTKDELVCAIIEQLVGYVEKYFPQELKPYITEEIEVGIPDEFPQYLAGEREVKVLSEKLHTLPAIACAAHLGLEKTFKFLLKKHTDKSKELCNKILSVMPSYCRSNAHTEIRIETLKILTEEMKKVKM